MDRAAQGLIEEHMLGGDKAMLLGCRSYGCNQRLGFAGLGQKAEDLPMVDGRDGRLDIGLAGKEDAHGVRRALSHLTQEDRAVHFRHTHVRHDDDRWIVAVDNRKAGLAIGRGRHAKVSLQADG